MEARHLIFSFFFALMLVGCATQPVRTADAIQTPGNRVHDKTFLRPASNTASVTVKRDSGLGGGACNTSVFTNGKLTAELASSEKIVLHLPEGSYVISARANDPCSGGLVEVQARVIRDNPLTFRIGYGTNGEFGLYPTAF